MKNRILLIFFCIIFISGAAAAQELPVEVVRPQVKTIRLTGIENGRVEPYKNVMVSAKLGGLVTDLNVEVGQYVKEGAILLQFDKEELLVQLKQAEASLELAEANLKMIRDGASREEIEQVQGRYEQALASFEQAEREFKRMESLYQENVITQKQFEAVKTQLEAARANLKSARASLDNIKKGADKERIKTGQANVRQAEAGLEMIQIKLRDSTVKSPINGIVANVSVEKGELVGRGTPLISIVNLDSVYIKTDVSAEVLKHIKKGDRVKAEILAYSEFREGVIEVISPVISRESQAFPIKVLVENRDHSLKGGMFADIYLTLKKSENTLVLPLEAVLNIDSNPYIYTIKDGVAQKRKIETGIINEKEVEITEGLKKGEVVVINGQHLLQSGDPVEVINQ